MGLGIEILISFPRPSTSGYQQRRTIGHKAYWNLPPKLVSLETRMNDAANKSMGNRKAIAWRDFSLERKPNKNASINGPPNRRRLLNDSQNESQYNKPPPFA